MASEIISVPDEDLREVIEVIRAGLFATSVSDTVRLNLTNYCDEFEEYLDMLAKEERTERIRGNGNG